MAEFKLLFKQKVADDTAVAPLKKAVENGNLGPLTVNPDSLKIVNEFEDEGNLKTLCNENCIGNSPLLMVVASIHAQKGVDEDAAAEAVAPD